MANDPGYWVVKCSGCAEPFCIANLHDVYDSFTDVTILSREEGNIELAQAPVAHQVAVYNLEQNVLRLQYDYAVRPLYECSCAKPLDQLARQQLVEEFEEVNKAVPVPSPLRA